MAASARETSGDGSSRTESAWRAALGVAPESFATVFQVHSPDVIVVDEPWDEGVRPLADAMVTRRPGLAIAVSSADCGPLLFADEEARVIGAAHAGWKGALTGVIEATIAAMEGQGAERARIHAALGPMISRAAYEVGPEFKARFLEADAAHAEVLHALASGRPFDVRPAGLHRRTLEASRHRQRR